MRIGWAWVLATTSRLLELLELLQSRPVVTGAEIARLLAVDRRTVRRYIAALQELGIPVEGQRGAGGGYKLRPGYRLPPLMLTGDEAVMAVIGLMAARHLGVDSADGSVAGALAKLRRVLPGELSARTEALQDTLGFTASVVPGTPVAGGSVLLLAGAIRNGRRVRAGYESSSGELSGRELSPHGVVIHSGRWYLTAYDHSRGARRTFRVDRMRHLTVTELAAREAPADFDPVAEVSRSLARIPWRWQVEVLVQAPVAQVAQRLPSTLAELTAAGDDTVLRMRVDSLDWMATLLAGLECGFTIRQPPELRRSVQALAARLAASANSASNSLQRNLLTVPVCLRMPK